jgi:hypothetical protein
LSDESEPMDKYFKDEILRKSASDALEEIESTRFLTVFPELQKIFSVPIIDDKGSLVRNPSTNEIETIVPPQYQSLFKATLLIANQLVRTGNITLKEADLLEIDADIQMLELEMMNGDLPAWQTSLRIYISMSIKDAIEAHRISAITIKKIEALISGEKKKRKKILGIF